ncbi:MAG TPA: ABC transporter ATP-binding protein [Candidatus Thermoplasmatota archaeon]|nr:ABC transporter ATP-binding protein [Candidatus Thermoplasmatota archaeon]
MNLRVEPGELVAVVGPNGAGKSTLVKAVVGVARVFEGRVTFDGQDLLRRTASSRVRLGISYVPQVRNVFPSLTVRENLTMGAFVRPEREAELLETVLAAFPKLAERALQRAGSLSGGERQMLALGKALMSEPRLLVVDEPAAALAPVVADSVFERLASIRDGGTAVLAVEQRARRILSMADRAYVLDRGRNRFEGRGPEVLADPEMGRSYLGPAGPATPGPDKRLRSEPDS